MMSENPNTNPQVNLFLERLRKLDAGERAQLKRCAGLSLREAPHLMGLFFRVLPAGVGRMREEAYFAIATLFPLVEEGGQDNFGTALRRARPVTKKDERAPLDRRIEILLDADWDQFVFRLRQALRLLKSKEVKVNWQHLADDMLYWTHPKRTVQERWARAYFAEQPKA